MPLDKVSTGTVQGTDYQGIRRVWDGAEALRRAEKPEAALALYLDANQRCDYRLTILTTRPEEPTDDDKNVLKRMGLLPRSEQPTDAELTEQSEVESLRDSIEERVRGIISAQPGLIGRVTSPSMLVVIPHYELSKTQEAYTG